MTTFFKFSTLIVGLLTSFAVIAQGNNCSSASSITSNTSCVNSSFTLSNGNSGNGSNPCGSSINDDGWFQFTATSSPTTTIEISGASNNIALVVYSGTCGTLTDIGCDDQGGSAASVSVLTTVGVVYYIKIIRTNNGGGSTNGNICVHGVISSSCWQESFETYGTNPGISNPGFMGHTQNHPPSDGQFTISTAPFAGTTATDGSNFAHINIGTAPGAVIFQTTTSATLTPGTSYTFNIDLRDYAVTRGNLTINIRSTVSPFTILGTLNTGSLAPSFATFSVPFIPTETSVQIELIDVFGASGSGNDVSLDNLWIDGCPPLILGVDQLFFSASLNECIASLNWTTVSENNVQEFKVERSRDGINWTLLSTVPASGNSNSIHQYSHVDESPLSGANYYRIRVIDFDGAVEISDLRALQFECITMYAVYPNPTVDGKIYIRLESNYFGAIKAKVVDCQGRIVSQSTHEISPKENVIVNYGVENCSKGSYFLIIETDEGEYMSSHKLIVQ